VAPVVPRGGLQPQFAPPTPTPPPAEETFPIPPVIERPLGVEEGPRVVVRSFVLDGAVDRPEQGIRVQDLQALLDARRGARPDGFSIGQLQETANEITNYYRQRGYVLAQAFVPEQTVADGVVTIRVLEGRVGRLVVENNQLYSPEVLTRPFSELEGQPATNAAVEEGFLRLADYPGLSAFGIFRPGAEVGTADLVINVQKEKRFEAALQFDNHGFESTGELRVFGDFTWNNPTGAADRLSLRALQTIDPAEQWYGFIDYARPIFGPENLLGVNVSRNDFQVPAQLQAAGVEGYSVIGDLYLRHSFVRSRQLNLYGLLDFARKHSRLDDEAGAFENDEDDLSVLGLELGFDHVDTRFQGINQGSIRVSQGIPSFLGSMDRDGDGHSTRVGGSGDQAGGDFTVVAFSLARLQSIAAHHSLLLRLEGQYSEDLLTSLEQMSLGGPYSVRAYSISEYLADTAIFASAEWIMDAPGFADKPAFAGRTWGEVFQVSLFLDYAHGELNDPIEEQEESDAEFGGYGLGLQLGLTDKFLARLDLSNKLTRRDPANDRDTQYWFSLRYEF
jgi:hemolysin activation/secretion protein